MSAPTDEQDPPETDRTIIRPSPAPAPAPAAPAPDRTVIAPQAGASPAPPPMAARADGVGIQVGDVLNHIFEVRRFIARGGMGEVFEGVNVNSDERVAIKVILPALANDPNVQAMFRKEARTLTRLSHPALVQYRVLAQEPQLNVFYIVTEFIDGSNLSDVLGKLSPTPDGLVDLTRRLASGLEAAHALGAIHRDISPDNVLLEDGRLDRARIIDFGIAKDLDPGSKTIIGDGFAGKLGYVAPEQLGDFDRQVGPWSDVYSLGLVILAVALGRNVDMGGNFVEAIDRRRKGVDTSGAPEAIRPVLDRMLVADPAQRLRSMDAVIAELTQLPAPAPAGRKRKPAAPAPKPKVVRPESEAKAMSASASPSRQPLVIGGVAAGLGVVALAAWLALSGGDGPDRTAAKAPAATGNPAAASPVAAAQRAVTAALPGIGCTWLDVTNISAGAGGVSLALAGIAGLPAEAESQVFRAVEASGGRVASTDFSEVAPISGSECTAIDAFRAIRATEAARLSVPQRKFEMSVLPPDSAYAGAVGARAVVNLDLADPNLDFALYGIEPSGAISTIVPNRAVFAGLEKTGTPIADLGGDRYRLQIDADHAGWSGILLLTGKGGFSEALMDGNHGAEWQAQFATAAQRNGWRAEMVWFKMVDEVRE